MAGSPAPRSGPEQPTERRARDNWWPAVDTLEKAQNAARRGFWASIINMVLTGLLLTLALFGGQYRGQDLGADMVVLMAVEFGLFLPLALGLWYFMRSAAIGALVAYVASELVSWWSLGLVPDIFSVLLFLCFIHFFIHGVRGCFAVQRIYLTHP